MTAKVLRGSLVLGTVLGFSVFAPSQSQDIGRWERRDLRAARHELRADNKDIRRDRCDLRRDVRDLRYDQLDLRRDWRGVRHN